MLIDFLRFTELWCGSKVPEHSKFINLLFWGFIEHQQPSKYTENINIVMPGVYVVMVGKQDQNTKNAYQFLFFKEVH